MVHRSRIVALAVAACAAVSACSPNVTDPGYYLVHGNAHAVVSPTSYMAAVGCVPHSGPRDSATIAFKLIGGGMARFDCAGTSKDSVASGIHAYRDAVFASSGNETAGGGGDDGYVYIHTYYTCDIENHYTYSASMHEYVYQYSDSNCTYWEIWDDGTSLGTYGQSTGGNPGDPNPIPLPKPFDDNDYCNPAIMGCLMRLHPKQLAYVQKSLEAIDTTNSICAAALAVERQLIGNNQVFYGAIGPNIAPGIVRVQPHSGLTTYMTDSDGHTIMQDGRPVVATQHIDQDVLKTAMNNGDKDSQALIGLLLVHEGMHALGYADHVELGPPYASAPYNLADPQNGQAVCARPGFLNQ